MNRNEQAINEFYTAFAAHHANAMSQRYHPEVEFHDPVFGDLKGPAVMAMWAMLLERSKGNLEIKFFDIVADNQTGRANWIATYPFSKTGRTVVNHVRAQFKFQDGLIIKHDDHFDLWKWSLQAFGAKGYLLGWTPFMQGKIKAQAQASLAAYRQKNT